MLAKLCILGFKNKVHKKVGVPGFENAGKPVSSGCGSTRILGRILNFGQCQPRSNDFNGVLGFIKVYWDL